MLSLPSERRARRLPLTALIDVVFLLVIFFVASSSFLSVGRIALADGREGPAAGGEADAAPSAPVADVLVSLRAGGRILVNGEAIEDDGLARRLVEARARGAGSLLVEAGAGASVADLAEAIGVARAEGFVRVGVRP